MENKFKISASPHVRDKRTTTSLMLDVIIALLPATFFGIYNFGVKALVLVLTCIGSCVLFEYLAQIVFKRKPTLTDLSAIVTGLLLALNLSPEVPVWMAILGSAFAIIIVKQLFGGLGYNFMNPALGARCFLMISFAGIMTTFSYDGVTSATPLYILKNGGHVDVVKMFIGTIGGTIGETSAICLIIGGLYLIVRKVIKITIPFFYIGTFAICIMIYALAAGRGFDLSYLWAHLFGGGLMLGAFFMATDYVTSPITPMGKVVFGILLGVLTFVFRIFGGSAEGVSYSIIFGNLLVPLIENVTQPKAFGAGAELAAAGDTSGNSKKMDVKSIVIATVAIFVITLIAGFALAYVQKITEKPIADANQKAKEEAYQQVYKDAKSFDLVELNESDVNAYLDKEDYNVDINEIVEAKDGSGAVIGYVIVATSHEGYGGDVKLAVGVTNEGVTTGISFLSLSETAGLGMQADTDEFKAQFKNKKADKFKYTKSGASSEDEIDALSGATITTNAVTNAVNAGIGYVSKLKGGN